MSTEQPIIRNFSGLEPFEDLVREITIQIVDGNKLHEQVPLNSVIRRATTEVGALGIEIQFGWSPDALQAAAVSARVPSNMINVVVLAEDGFLKERAILESFPLDALPPSLKVVQVAQQRHPALQNSHHGFDLIVTVVLAEDLEPRMARRPHRKGTVLANGSLSVRPNQDAAGLDPQPLTAQVRKENGDLPVSTRLLVVADGDLVTAEDIANAIQIYVHEDLLVALARSRGPEQAAMLRMLASEAWGHIVWSLHAELSQSETFEWDGDRGAVLRALLVATKKVKKVAAQDLITLLRNRPNELAALLSGADNTAKTLIQVLSQEDAQESAS